jgi:hypothetical protein
MIIETKQEPTKKKYPEYFEGPGGLWVTTVDCYDSEGNPLMFCTHPCSKKEEERYRRQQQKEG